MKQYNIFFITIFFITGIGISMNSCQNEVNVPDPLVEETIYEVSYGDESLQKFDIYLPADRTENTKVLIFIHGGGWNSGDKSDYVIPIAGLEGHDFAIANIDYRLATGAGGITLAQQADDIRACIDYIKSVADKFVISPDQFIISGHSAGGHLALYTAYHNNADGVIKAAISLAGPTDLTDPYFIFSADMYPLIENLIGIPYATDTTAWINGSPLHYVDTNCPPTLLQYCGLDFTVPAGQGDILNTSLNTTGVEHQFFIYPYYSHDMGTIFYGGDLPPDVQSDLLQFVGAHAN